MASKLQHLREAERYWRECVEHLYNLLDGLSQRRCPGCPPLARIKPVSNLAACQYDFLQHLSQVISGANSPGWFVVGVPPKTAQRRLRRAQQHANARGVRTARQPLSAALPNDFSLADLMRLPLPRTASAWQTEVIDPTKRHERKMRRWFALQQRRLLLAAFPPRIVAEYQIIQQQGRGNGISGKDMVADLKQAGYHISAETFRRHDVPVLKTQLGVKNDTARGGYYLP